MFKFLFPKKGKIKVHTPITRRQKIEVKIITPDWKQYIEI